MPVEAIASSAIGTSTMEITISKFELLRELAATQGVVERKTKRAPGPKRDQTLRTATLRYPSFLLSGSPCPSSRPCAQRVAAVGFGARAAASGEITSARSRPRSLRSTIAAFLPGAPVTEPPGWVVEPVW